MRDRLYFFVFLLVMVRCLSRHHDKLEIALVKVVSNYPEQKKYGYSSNPRLDLVLHLANRSNEVIAVPIKDRFDSDSSMFYLRIQTKCGDTLLASLYGITGIKYVILNPNDSKSIVLTTYFRELNRFNQLCDSSYIGFFLKKIGEEGEVEFICDNDSISINGMKYVLPKEIDFHKERFFKYEAPIEPAIE